MFRLVEEWCVKTSASMVKVVDGDEDGRVGVGSILLRPGRGAERYLTFQKEGTSELNLEW